MATITEASRVQNQYASLNRRAEALVKNIKTAQRKLLALERQLSAWDEKLDEIYKKMAPLGDYLEELGIDHTTCGFVLDENEHIVPQNRVGAKRLITSSR